MHDYRSSFYQLAQQQGRSFNYEPWRRELRFKFQLHGISHFLLDALGSSPHAETIRVLDAGCGEGAFLRIAKQFLAKQCDLHVSFFGTDFCLPFLSLCREVEPKVCEADIRSLPFADRSFDVILCFNVLEYVADTQQALREFERLLKSEGVLIVMCNKRFTDPFVVPSILGPARRLLTCRERRRQHAALDYPSVALAPRDIVNNLLTAAAFDLVRSASFLSSFNYPFYERLLPSVSVRRWAVSRLVQLAALLDRIPIAYYKSKYVLVLRRRCG